jgi:hypothetical protein
MRRYLPLTMPFVVLLAACSQQSDQRSSQPESVPANQPSMDMAEVDVDASAPPSEESARMPTGPGIAPTAAPGVAFNYRYGFRLPAQRIAEVQRQHASACEKMGIDRCRITGMHYRLVNDRDIEGMLAFKLDPMAARKFGEDGVDLVARAEGMLVEAQITGEDAGSEITAATRSEARLQEELREVEEQLKRTGLRSAERAELQMQAERLRESIRANQTTREEKRESLAKTPLVFRYGSGDLAPGFDNDAPIGKALENAGDNIVSGVAAFLLILGSLLPWLLLGLLGWFGWRQVNRRFLGGASRPVSQSAAASEE